MDGQEVTNFTSFCCNPEGHLQRIVPIGHKNSRRPVSDVMLLIGKDAPEAHIQLEVCFGNKDQPYAIRSKLGWAVRRPIGNANSAPLANIHFQQSGDIVLQQQLERLWMTDFKDGISSEKECMSVEDKKSFK